MTKTWLLGLALLLLIAALPLVSIGMDENRDGLWWTGVVLLAAGGLVALLTRRAGRPGEEDQS